jgi:hypothetical protein
MLKQLKQALSQIVACTFKKPSLDTIKPLSAKFISTGLQKGFVPAGSQFLYSVLHCKVVE